MGVAAKGRIAAMRTKTAEGEEVVTQSILAGRFGPRDQIAESIMPCASIFVF